MGTNGGEEPTMSEDKILVLVRLRPLSKKEKEKKEVLDWECLNEKTIVFRNNLQERSMHPVTHTFDRVFNGDCSTRKVYEEGTKDIAPSVVSGINSSILAYGQTSSGKTYTMSGIMEYAVADIYNYILKHEERAFVIKFSAMEIYNEAITDLLCTDNTLLRVRDDPEKGAFVENLTEEISRDWGHLKELLSICKAQRRTGETSLNEASSRSHQIVRLTVESSAREYLGKENSTALSASLNFVDLAGSERSSQASSAGDRLKEGCHINSSLFTLGNVIRKLSGKGRQGHVSYRDSKLTRILQPCLGGNTRTAIICTLSPAQAHVEQSRNTLHFASCAKEVRTNAKVNVVLSDKALLKRLQSEVAQLATKLKVPAPSFTCDCAVLLREKDLQIEKLEMEVKELTTQRDLADSLVEHLQLLIKKYETSTELLKDTCIEVQCIESNKSSEEEASELSTFSTCDDVATSTLMVHSYGNEAFESVSPCKEETANLKLRKPLMANSFHSSRRLRNRYIEDEFSEDEIFIFGDLPTKEDEGTSILMVDNDDDEAFESSSSYEKEISKFRKQWALAESQVEKVKSSLRTDTCNEFQCTETDEFSEEENSKSIALSTEEDDSNSTLPSHRNGNKSPKSFYPKDLIGRLPPSSADVSTRNRNKRASPRLDYGAGIAKLSTQLSISSQNHRTAPDGYFPSISNFVADIEEMAKKELEKSMANSQGTQKYETQNTSWNLIFVRLQKAILELWQLCNISLVHRTYFFLVFKGDPADSIYMEIELRRLSLLDEAFSKGNHAVQGGQPLTLESSIEALRREREMLSRLISKKFSRSQRSKLYEKWGINLETKQRKRQLVNLLWGSTNDLNHVINSADIVGKLIGYSVHGTSLKEMFGFSLIMGGNRRSFSWK